MTASLLISILSTIALFFIIFAMAAIILLARRMALLSDDLRSLVEVLKNKIPSAADKVTETAEEAHSLLSNVRKMSDLTQNLQALLSSNKKLVYYVGVFLAFLKTALNVIPKTKNKTKKEVDKCVGKQE